MKKSVSNLLSTQIVGFEQTFMKFIEIFVRKNNFFTQKKNVVEAMSVAITDSSNVQNLNLYLINIFTKSTKEERCT